MWFSDSLALAGLSLTCLKIDCMTYRTSQVDRAGLFHSNLSLPNHRWTLLKEFSADQEGLLVCLIGKMS